MSAIASPPPSGWLRRHWLEIGLAAFIAANLVAMTLGPWPTVPFHFIWVSLTVAFGIRMWTSRTMAVGLTAVVLLSGWALFATVQRAGGGGFDEMTEVPLMAVIFLTSAWQVRKRQRASDELTRMADVQDRLLESQREFVRDSTHGLRTPITIARGYAELVHDALPTGAIRDDAVIVIEELDRLARYADRLLLLAAVEHPDFLRTHPLALGPFVNRVIERWAVVADRRWFCFVALDGTIEADEERLSLAIDSLLENAVGHTDAKGSISIRTRPRGGSLIIEIKDDGTGIAPEDLEPIFERFGRAARPGRTGTGLGLPIVRAIVRAHGGEIRVASRPGAGATFTIELPGFRASPASATPTPLGGDDLLLDAGARSPR